MTKLVWDQTGQRLYETGVSAGVLYIPDSVSGEYDEGVAWNGLTTVTETPTGAESTKLYADNIPYLNLTSLEEFTATLEAYMYPPEFQQFDGFAAPSEGVTIGQQSRKPFGLSYQTRVGNDVLGSDYGYKIHLVYGATAAPSEKAYATINDSPEAITLSWELTTSPVAVTGYKPTALLTIDSTKVDSGQLADLEDILYGTPGQDPRLPFPDEVLALFAGAATEVNLVTLANQPSYDSGTHVVTLPSVTGITWRVNGIVKAAGAQPAMTVGQTSAVTAHPQDGYVLSDESDDRWVYPY